jgi:CheY-like chemotaxis protein
MSRANPTSRRLRVINPTLPLPRTPSIDAKTETDADDDVVALRTQALLAPLDKMVVFAELAATTDITDAERQLYVASLLRWARRLLELINKALALQRLEAGHGDLDLAPVDVGVLVHRAVIAAGEDERLPINVEVAESLPLVSADAEAILEVLANFLSNARVFSPGGGAINVGCRLAGDVVEVSIQDHGVGVEADAVPKLFRKFYRTDVGVRGRGPGAGLGLAINRRIIEAHGGQVSASSRGRGKGARFQFTLPVAGTAPKAGYILIVEDDPAFAKLLKAEFAIVGLETIRAADGETAQQLISGTMPRAIVLDLWLPGLQGEDFLASVGGSLPVVVLTAKDLKPEDHSALDKSGAMAVLPKEAGAPQAAAALIAEALSLVSVSQ